MGWNASIFHANSLKGHAYDDLVLKLPVSEGGFLFRLGGWQGPAVVDESDSFFEDAKKSKLYQEVTTTIAICYCSD